MSATRTISSPAWKKSANRPKAKISAGSWRRSWALARCQSANSRRARRVPAPSHGSHGWPCNVWANKNPPVVKTHICILVQGLEFHTPCPWLLHGPWIPTVSAKESPALTASWPVAGHANLWPRQSSKFVLCEHPPAAMRLWIYIPLPIRPVLFYFSMRQESGASSLSLSSSSFSWLQSHWQHSLAHVGNNPVSTPQQSKSKSSSPLPKEAYRKPGIEVEHLHLCQIRQILSKVQYESGLLDPTSMF